MIIKGNTMTIKEKVLKDIEEEFGVIKDIPSQIGLYDSRPIFVEDPDLVLKNIHVAERFVDGIQYVVRQYSPSFRQKDSEGYFYIVYWNILSPLINQY